MNTTVATRTSKSETKEKLLLRYRAKDTPNGITKHTALEAAEALGLTETQLVHLALSQFVARTLPRYEADDGPLSRRAWTAIIRRVDQTQHGEIISSLFPDD